MSIAFGMVWEGEISLQALSQNHASQNPSLPGVWEKLEEIAVEKGLIQLSQFIVEDAELYREMLDAAEAFENLAQGIDRSAMQEKLQALAQQPEWFAAADAAAARETLRGLIEHLQANPDLFTPYGDEANTAILADLEGFDVLLAEIESNRLPFKFWIE